MSEFSMALRLFRSLNSWAAASVAEGEVKERESPKVES
jgi:hypothetical protein